MKTKKQTRPARPAAWIQRLLQRMAASPPPHACEPPPAEAPLAPEGQRSGRGTRSITPYLDQARNTRPGALE